MKKKMSLEQFEQKLISAGPKLAAMLSSKPDLSPERIEKLNKLLEAEHPFLRELTAKQMEALLLQILGQRPMDGFEITTQLEKANFKLKKGGAGVIFGLLAKLQSAGCLERREREGAKRMIITYHLTERGTGLLQKSKAPAAELKAWSELVLSAT
jgi:DNA-binding PadR family transcriptional regulator